MPPKEEIEEVIEWCERRKKESGKVALIVENPFREKFSWMYRFPYIEIDRPLEAASRYNLVYDSTTKTLWQWLNGNWRKIEADFAIIDG